MDFKFKEVVEESIIHFYDHVLSSNEYTEDVFEEINHVYVQAPKADEYETKNKELLEELQYLRKVNDDLVWQRDTDEEHEAKAKAWDTYKIHLKDEIKKLERKQPKHGDLLRRDGLVSALGLAMIVEEESGESNAEK